MACQKRVQPVLTKDDSDLAWYRRARVVRLDSTVASDHMVPRVDHKVRACYVEDRECQVRGMHSGRVWLTWGASHS